MNPENFMNRELSWLEFNRRVLEEAQDPSVPLLERVKFLAIFSSNLDECFMIRVATLKRRIEAGDKAPTPDGRSVRVDAEGRPPLRSQERLYEATGAGASSRSRADERTLIPEE